MEQELKLILQNMIKKNTLSSGMDENSVWYALQDQLSGNRVLFMCQHAYNTSNEIFADYYVMIDSIPVVRYTLPTLHTFHSSTSKPDIIQLMEMCAQKVIQQQNIMKKINFLLINNNINTYS